MARAVVGLEDTTPEEGALLLIPGANLVNGESGFRAVFGAPTSLEADVLTLASAIFACDLAFKRGERENITRQIELTVPVINLPAFNSILSEMQYALYVLSHDAWSINFTQRQGKPEAHCDWPQDQTGKVLLFSGGLDAFSAAVQCGDADERIELVSHITANRVVSSAQEGLFEYLQTQYPSQFDRVPFRVGGRNQARKGLFFPSDQEREETQRTRSFLFLSLAALVARRKGLRDVLLIAENGQMAIHLPLTAARIGAFSTYTAHPEFVAVMSDLLSSVLGYAIRVENPFLYRTKSEVVSTVVTEHHSMLEHTVSCWMASRVGGDKKHCGLCIPCLVRRIAIESHGITIPEYQRDLLNEEVASLAPEDDGKRNLVELGEFVRIFESDSSQAALESLYPELVNPYIASEQAVAMYRRFAAEARSVFDRYPTVKEFLV